MARRRKETKEKKEKEGVGEGEQGTGELIHPAEIPRAKFNNIWAFYRFLRLRWALSIITVYNQYQRNNTCRLTRSGFILSVLSLSKYRLHATKTRANGHRTTHRLVKAIQLQSPMILWCDPNNHKTKEETKGNKSKGDQGGI